MNLLERLFGSRNPPNVQEPVVHTKKIKEDAYELVHMKANNRWYATVNGSPLTWNPTTGLYVKAYSWDYADSHAEKRWAQYMVDHHRDWKNKETFSVEKA